MDRFPSSPRHLRRVFLSHLIRKPVSIENRAEIEGNGDTLSHGNAPGRTRARGCLHGISSSSTTYSRAADSQKEITTVTSTRLTFIANMVGLSRQMLMELLRPCSGGNLSPWCRHSGTGWPSAPRSGMTFSASSLFSLNAAWQSTDKEQVQR